MVDDFRRSVWDVTPDRYWSDNRKAEEFIKSVDFHPGRIYDIIGKIREDTDGKETLDLGCGTRLLGSTANVDLNTFSNSKKTGNFILASGLSLPFKDECFDAVTTIEVIEHVWNPTQFLQEIYRVLKRGGRLHLTTPNIAHLSITLRYLVGHRITIHCDHRHGWNWEMLAWFLHLCGFTNLEIYTWGFVDEMQQSGKKVRLYRSYQLCNFLDKLGFKFPFLYLNIYAKATKP
jgi:SAM-dependent methyltransferase